MEKLKEYGVLVAFVVLVGLVGVLALQPPTVVKVTDGEVVEVLGGGTSDFTNVNVKSGGSYSVADTAVIDSSRNLVGVDITGTYGYIKSTGAFVEQSVSSTLTIGNDSDGLNTGCLVLGDSGGTTSTPVYIIASGSTITASTTAPAICR